MLSALRGPVLVVIALLPATALAAKASSELKPSKVASYVADNAFDGNPATAWCEGAAGDGSNEWIEIPLGDARDLEATPSVILDVYNGYQKDKASFVDNGAPGMMRIELLGDGQVLGQTEAACNDVCQVYVPVKKEWKGMLALRITVLVVRAGARWKDTCISEVVPRLTLAQGRTISLRTNAELLCRAIEQRNDSDVKAFTDENAGTVLDELGRYEGGKTHVMCTVEILRSTTALDLYLPPEKAQGGPRSRRFHKTKDGWRLGPLVTWPRPH